MMKYWHVILIVAVGVSLIFFAPSSQKAGQADTTETASAPSQDAKLSPPPGDKQSPAKLEPASFAGGAAKLKNANN